MTIKDCNEPVATNIDKIVDANGLRKNFVAEKVGWTPAMLSDSLNGRRLIRAFEIPLLAKAMGVDPGDLFAT